MIYIYIYISLYITLYHIYIRCMYVSHLYEPLLHDAVEDLPALAVLHHEEHEAALLIGLQQLADVRVVQILLKKALKGLQRPFEATSFFNRNQ